MKFILFTHVFFSILILISIFNLFYYFMMVAFLEGYSAILREGITSKVCVNIFIGFVIILFLSINFYGLVCCLAKFKYDYKVFLYPFLFSIFMTVILPAIFYFSKR